MNDWNAFDQDLTASLGELPLSNETASRVTPWRRAMEHIVLGLCLTTFSLQFAYLQYLLPALGTAQLYLGFRSLRKANRYFRLAYWLSTCKAIALYMGFLLEALRFPVTSHILTGNTALSILLTLGLYLLLHLALCQTAQDQRPRRRPALWAAGWHLVMVALALFLPQPGFPLFLVMVIVFVRILKSLAMVFAELEDCGYALRAAPVRISDKHWQVLFLASLGALVLLCSLWSNHLPLPETSEQRPTIPNTAVQTRLLDLGFPGELLDLLPASELQALESAELCLVNPDARETSTDVGVRFDDVQVRIGPRTFRCYHFFDATGTGDKSVWQNDLTLHPNSYGAVSDVAGQLTWEHRGVPYGASLPLAKESTLTYFGDQETTWNASFSYPIFTQARRGWAAYTISISPDASGSNSILSYRVESYGAFYPYRPLREQPLPMFSAPQQSQSYSTFSVG